MTKALAVSPQADCNMLVFEVGLPNGNDWLLIQRLQLPRFIYAIVMNGFGVGG